MIAATPLELQGIKFHHKNWSPISFDGNGQTYYETAFIRDEKKHKVVFALQSEVGMVAATALSAKLIEHFRPRYLIETGIAAGVSLENEQRYGDVIVADVIWTYDTGKFVKAENAKIRFGNVGFISKSSQFVLDSKILEYIKKAINSPRNPNHVLIGPIACGASVVSNREILQQQVYMQKKQTIGLDMESYGIVYMATHATAPRPTPIIIKSVSDYADEKKDDRVQKFSAYTSAEFAKFLYEDFLPLE